jgi:hypothetical protein
VREQFIEWLDDIEVQTHRACRALGTMPPPKIKPPAPLRLVATASGNSPNKGGTNNAN